MLRLARFSARRPLASLAMWFLVAVLGVSHSLSPSVVVVPGSEAAAARDLAES